MYIHHRRTFEKYRPFLSSFFFLRRDKIRRVESTLVELRIMLRTFLVDGILRHCESFAYFFTRSLALRELRKLCFLAFFTFALPAARSLGSSFTTSFRTFPSQKRAKLLRSRFGLRSLAIPRCRIQNVFRTISMITKILRIYNTYAYARASISFIYESIDLSNFSSA